jgi:hypothetical protein
MIHPMDVLWFLKRRTAFIRRFYQSTSPQFLEIKRKVESREAPYNSRPVDPSGEPPYLEEWQDAEESVEFLGQACVSFLAASVKLFLTESEREFRAAWSDLIDFPHVAIGESGILSGYEEWFRGFGIDFHNSGSDVELIREIVATRNLAQHPRSIGLMHLSQRDTDRRKFSMPSFAHPLERALLKSELDHEIPWMLSITPEAFVRACGEVDRFCEWLEDEWRDGPNAIPGAPPANMVGMVINYFAKVQVAGVKLVADISVGDTVRFLKAGIDFEQRIESLEVDRSSVRTAKAGAEIGLKVERRATAGTRVYKVSQPLQ